MNELYFVKFAFQIEGYNANEWEFLRLILLRTTWFNGHCSTCCNVSAVIDSFSSFDFKKLISLEIPQSVTYFLFVVTHEAWECVI